MVKAQTPTIAKIKNNASETDARALVSLAICEVCDFFNVGKNMTDTQVAITTDLIIERFWYMKLEEIKYCFRRAMGQERMFDRLDGNIIIGWLNAYDNERTYEAMRISEQEDALAENASERNPEAVTFDQYLEWLRNKADSGDADAARQLYEIEHPEPSRMKILTSKESRQKELDFLKWYHTEYSKKKS